MTSFSESVVEQAALAWLESAGWRVRNGAEIALAEPAGRASRVEQTLRRRAADPRFRAYFFSSVLAHKYRDYETMPAMPPAATLKVRKVLRRAGAARAFELEAAGVPRAQLSRLVASGELQRLARGLYALPDFQGTEHSALLAVAKRAPHAVFCLLTALRLHELTTQAPFEVWIAIGNKEHAPRLDYPPLRVVRFASAALAAGVETLRVEGTQVRVTNAAKTVADCFKFRNKIGLDVALEALREARRAKKAGADELWRYARLNRVANVMRPYLEAVT